MQAGGIARTWRAAQWLLIMLGAIGSAPAAVDDSVVQDVRIEGNQAISSAALSSAIMLKSGAALSRELVLADVERIEALYQRAGKRVAVATDLTHPGEHEGNPRTTLTFRINESPKTHGAQASASADPLEIYYDNTLVCAAAKTLNDLCHLWLNRDGTFINF